MTIGGICVFATLVLAILNFIGVITIPWLVVFLPVLAFIAVSLIGLVCFAIIGALLAGMGALMERLSR